MKNTSAKIKITFKKFKDIFDEWREDYPPLKKSSRQSDLYIPDSVTGGQGLKLKGGVGYIKIRQKLNKNGVPVSYLYSFVSTEYDYLVVKNCCEKIDSLGEFCFHFQMDENDIPHKPHVSVMSPSAFRYYSKNITLAEFLTFIRDHFYSTGGNKRDNILLNRLISTLAQD